MNKQAREDIFLEDKVDIVKFKEGFNLVPEEDLEWWNISGKDLISGQVSLSNARFMSIGIEKDTTGFIVCNFWYET